MHPERLFTHAPMRWPPSRWIASQSIVAATGGHPGVGPRGLYDLAADPRHSFGAMLTNYWIVVNLFVDFRLLPGLFLALWWYPHRTRPLGCCWANCDSGWDDSYCHK
jgi:hypothetical protein